MSSADCVSNTDDVSGADGVNGTVDISCTDGFDGCKFSSANFKSAKHCMSVSCTLCLRLAFSVST